MNLSPWKYYLKFYRGSFRTLLFSVVLSAGQSLLVLPIAFIVRYAFDVIIPANDFQLLLLMGIAIFLLTLANSGVTLWTRYLTLHTTKLAVQRLRDELLTRCYAYSRAYHSEADRSKLHASMVQDTERVDYMSNALVALFVPAAVISIGLCGVLIFLNWYLFVVMMIAIPPLVLVSRVMRRRVREQVKAYHRAFEAFSKGMLFVLQMMDLTRIQTAEQFELKRQREHLERVRITGGSMAWLNAAYSSLHSSIVAVASVLILVVGGMAVAGGSMTLGSLLSFYVAVGMLNRYMQITFYSIPSIIEGHQSLITLFNTAQAEELLPYSGRTQIPFTGKVTLDSVSFQYKDEPVLQNIALTINAHTMVALIGPNGVGKTTIAHLILGLYRPKHGQLLADEHPYDQLDMIHLRRSIGVVMQNPIIFPGTIWENITYGQPDATHEEVVRASEMATAHDFIQQLPEGYETLTGEHGVLLSGGQRQRMAIARALLRTPKLLILDEPTNHLDEATVRQLMENLKQLDPTPAILMITQNMGIVQEAHSLHMMQEGGHIVTVEDRIAFLQESDAARDGSGDREAEP